MAKRTSPIAICALVLVFLSESLGLSCFECMNYADGKFYPHCPMNGTVDLNIAFLGECDGTCFTRTDKADPTLVVRGCTTPHYLPDPLPDDGCYDWNGAVWCLCSGSSCNLAAMGESSGVRLDAHLNDPNRTVNMDGPLQCYQCVNTDDEGVVYDQCAKDDNVMHTLVYHGNCSGSCFTRSEYNNTDYVARGCTDTQWGMPEPMAPTGCYTHNSATWCICDTHYCNGRPLGEPTGKRLDDHIYNFTTAYEEKDGIFKCYNCKAIDEAGKYWPQCPKDERVSNAFLTPCNGSCITRSYDENDEQVGRGCSDQMGILPDPLPDDGCYTWYLQVWCVCSTSRCNGRAIGDAMGIEFDAHIGNSGSALTSRTGVQILSFVSVYIISRWLHNVGQCSECDGSL